MAVLFFLMGFFTVKKFLYAGRCFFVRQWVFRLRIFSIFCQLSVPLQIFRGVQSFAPPSMGYLKFLGCPNRHFFSNIINIPQLLPFRKNNGGTVYFTIAYMNVGNFFLA